MMAWGMLLSIDRVKAPTLVLAPRVRDKTSFLSSLAEWRKTIGFANGNSQRLGSIGWPSLVACCLSQTVRTVISKKFTVDTGGAAQLGKSPDPLERPISWGLQFLGSWVGGGPPGL